MKDVQRARPMVRMPGAVAFGTGSGEVKMSCMKASTRALMSEGSSFSALTSAQPDVPAC